MRSSVGFSGLVAQRFDLGLIHAGSVLIANLLVHGVAIRRVGRGSLQDDAQDLEVLVG